jgi:hypothetical protein
MSSVPTFNGQRPPRGVRAGGVKKLRPALPDRRSDASGIDDQDRRQWHIQPELHHGGVPRRLFPGYGLAYTHRYRPKGGKRFRSQINEGDRIDTRDRAALPDPYFQYCLPRSLNRRPGHYKDAH